MTTIPRNNIVFPNLNKPEIPSFKEQITNKFQYRNINDLDVNLFGVLDFGH